MNIKEAAAKCGVSENTIRYYEKVGLLTTIDYLTYKIDHYDDHISEVEQKLQALEKGKSSDELAESSHKCI